MSQVDVPPSRLDAPAQEPVGAPLDPAKVLAANINLLAGHQPRVAIASLLIAAGSVYWLWDMADRPTLVAWALAVVPLYVLRMLVLWRFRRDPHQTEHILYWSRAFTLAIALAGAWIGSTALLFFNPAEPMTVVFIAAIVLTGATKVAILSHHPPASYSFLTVAFLPAVVQCFSSGVAGYQTLGGFLTLLWCMNLHGAPQVYAGYVELFRLRLQNEELIRQLRIDRDRADDANRSKSTFLAAVSHDLRQPAHAAGLFLSTIIRMTERAAMLPAAQVRAIADNLHEALHSLSRLLDALLDISRLDAGLVKPQIAPVELQALLYRLETRFAAEASAKSIELRIHPTKANVLSDPLLLERILGNLVSNAIRYTSIGKVLVGCRRRAGGIEIQVLDTGPGIAAEHRDRIFEEFVQLDNPGRDRQRGLGLGLAIVRRCAQLLAHPIKISGSHGVGAVFAVCVPLASQSAPLQREQTPTSISSIAGLSILVVDDEAIVRKGMAEMLAMEACETVLCAGLHDLQEAIQRAGLAIDLIIADYRLGDGRLGTEAIDTARRILRRAVPAIIITGDTAPERMEQAQAAGHRLLHKPVAAETLIEAITALVPSKS